MCRPAEKRRNGNGRPLAAARWDRRGAAPEAARIEAARRQVLDLFHRWGYEFVVTPHIEYLESLLTGAGQDLDLRTFKVTDPASGRLMGFRADITPQVARMDAHSLRREDRAAYAMPAACCMRSARAVHFA